MDSSSSPPSDGPRPKRLKTLASSAGFSEGNALLHRFVLDNSDPNASGSVRYIKAVLLSMSDVPASVVNALNDDGYSALHLAVVKKNHVMVQKLLSCLLNVDINARCGQDEGNTALHLAVISRHASIVQELLNKGADLTIMNRHEETALDVAIFFRNSLDIVKILVSADVNQHTLKSIPLPKAAFFGRLEIVEFLMDRGVDLGSRIENGSTALHAAAYMGFLDIAKFLIDKGADLHATDGYGETPLHRAVEGFSLEENDEGNLECAAFLIDQGADLDARDHDGYTPLHRAVFMNKLECVAFLIEQGARLHARSMNGFTPLHTAAFNGDVEVTRALLYGGACVIAKNREGKTPLDLAREKGNQSCMDILENEWRSVMAGSAESLHVESFKFYSTLEPESSFFNNCLIPQPYSYYFLKF